MKCAFEYEIDGETQPCQFNVPDEELIQLPDGTCWCEYHCPMEVKSSDGTVTPTIKSEWSKERKKQFSQNIEALIQAAAQTDSTADFRGVVFPVVIHLKGLRVKTINFRDSVFYQTANFSGSFFETVICDGAKFLKNAEFAGVTIKDTAWFFNVEFKYAIFNNAKLGHASFDKSSFRTADFENVSFLDKASFDRAAFSSARFSGSEFSEFASFINTRFVSACNFGSVRFDKDVNFEHAIFGDYTWFGNSIFSGAASFKGGTRPSSNQRIGNDCFNGAVSFKNVKFLSKSKKTLSYLGREIVFTNRGFNGPTNFSNSYFSQAPDFHNCQLHQYTNFKGAVFDDVKSEDADMAYRTLKLAMEQNRSRNEQSMFYALEQQALRHQPTTPEWRKQMSFLYEITSNFGQSATRPLLWLLATILFFYPNYALFHSMANKMLDHQAQVFSFTIKQTVRPFAVWADRGDQIQQLFGVGTNLFVKLLATVQSILSIVFITLTVLAIRWTFRKG